MTEIESKYFAPCPRMPTLEQRNIGGAVLRALYPRLESIEAIAIALEVWTVMFDARPPREALIAFPGLSKGQAQHYEIILEFVEEHRRPPSQPELAAITGLRQQTISELQLVLVKKGFLRRSARTGIEWIKPRA